MRPTLVRSLALAALVAAAPAFAAPIDRPVERTLPNGLRVLVLQRPRLPIVEVQLMVPGGASRDPAGQAGLAMMTAQMLKRGTTSRSADEFAAAVDRLGGTIGAQATREYSMLSGAFLARDLESGLELMSGAVLDPLFPDEELARLRLQSFRALVQTRVNPALLVDEQVWGTALAGHPYGEPVGGDSRSLGALSRQSLREAHRDVWRPDHAVLAIAGDVTPERGFALASDWFGRWEGRSAPAAPPNAPTPPARPRLVLVDLPSLDWAEIRLALVMPGRLADDAAAASLAASAFAGGPASRLTRAPGGIGGAVPRASLNVMRDGGLFVVSLAVPPDSAAGAVRRLRAELAAFAKSPPADADLAPLRHAAAAAFPLAFETLGGALSQWELAALDGRSADALAGTSATLGAVTASEVAAAAKRWFDPQHALVLVGGPAARLRAPLAALGTVESETVEPLTPPSMALATAAGDTLTLPTPERAARGRAAVARALKAHGGLALLRGIHDSEIEGDVSVHAGGRDISGQQTMLRKEPFRMLTDTHLISMQARQVLDNDHGWFQGEPDSVGVPLDSLGVMSMRNQFGTDLPHLLLAAADSAASVTWRGPSRSGDVPSDAVEVITAEGERRRYHFATADGRLVGVDQYGSTASDAPVLARRTYSDFRPVAGVQWPFREELASPGDNSVRLDVKSVRLNQGIPDLQFLRPVPR